MQKNNKLRKISDLISKGKTDVALKQLITLFDRGTNEYKFVLNYTSQFNQLLKRKQLGIIENSEATFEHNKITNAVIDFLSDFEFQTQNEFQVIVSYGGNCNLRELKIAVDSF